MSKSTKKVSKKKPKPRDIVPAWKAESLRSRLHRCRIMLLLHNILTDKENSTTRNRIHTKHGYICTTPGNNEWDCSNNYATNLTKDEA